MLADAVRGLVTDGEDNIEFHLKRARLAENLKWPIDPLTDRFIGCIRSAGTAYCFQVTHLTIRANDSMKDDCALSLLIPCKGRISGSDLFKNYGKVATGSEGSSAAGACA